MIDEYDQLKFIAGQVSPFVFEKMTQGGEFFLFQDMMFLGDDGFLYHPDAYLIIPSSSGYPIFHQYGCTACYHFKTKGFVIPIQDKKLGQQLESLLGCDHDYNTPALILTLADHGLELSSVQSEALALLKNGWYIATCNCD